MFACYTGNCLFPMHCVVLLCVCVCRCGSAFCKQCLSCPAPQLESGADPDPTAVLEKVGLTQMFSVLLDVEFPRLVDVCL